MSNIEVYSPAHREPPRELNAGWRFILTYLLSLTVWENQQQKLRESQLLLLQPSNTTSTTNSEANSNKTVAETITDLSNQQTAINQSEIKQFVDTKDPLISVVNFILREVQPLKTREEKIQLLRYYLGSLLSESQQTPFSATGYEIVSENGLISLHDDVYRLNPDLLSVCELSVSKARNHLEKERFTLEKQQIEHIVTKLKTLLETGVSPHSLTEELTTLSEPKTTLPINWIEGKNQLTPKTAEKLGIPLNTPYLVEHKHLYFMPQSTVHKGGLSVAAIVQPIYVPSLKRFFLLHNQYLYKASWNNHLSNLERLGISIPPDIKSSKDAKVKEAYVMSLYLPLVNHQLENATQTFLTLFRKGSLTKLQQSWRELQLKFMDSSLTEYSELLLEVFEHEQATHGFSARSLENVLPFLKRIVLAGLFSHKQLNPKLKSKIFEFYKHNKHLAEAEFANQAAKTLSFLPAIKGFNFSLLECVSIGSITSLANPRLFSLTNLQQLTRNDLINYVGKERATLWTEHQTCSNCGTADVWVGECGWCLACETADSARTNRSTPASISSLSSTEVSPVKPLTVPSPPKVAPELTDDSVSLGSFVANLI